MALNGTKVLLAVLLMLQGPSVASAVCGLVVVRALSSTDPGLSLAQFGIMVLMGGNQVEMGARVFRPVLVVAVTSLLVLPLLSCHYQYLT